MLCFLSLCSVHLPYAYVYAQYIYVYVDVYVYLCRISICPYKNTNVYSLYLNESPRFQSLYVSLHTSFKVTHSVDSTQFELKVELSRSNRLESLEQIGSCSGQVALPCHRMLSMISCRQTNVSHYLIYTPANSSRKRSQLYWVDANHASESPRLGCRLHLCSCTSDRYPLVPTSRYGLACHFPFCLPLRCIATDVKQTLNQRYVVGHISVQSTIGAYST